MQQIVNSCNIVTREGCELAWINVVGYLEIYVHPPPLNAL